MWRSNPFLLLLLATGCVKPMPVPQATQPTNVAVVYALGRHASGEIESMPDSVQARVAEELEARNLVPVMMPAPASFESIRAPGARLAAIEGARSPVLLVSCDPRFDVQVNGRYRWVVPCDVAIDAVVAHTEPAAHLVYYHQDEDDAVLDVQTQIGREVARALDQWLQGSPRAVPAKPASPSQTGPTPL